MSCARCGLLTYDRLAEISAVGNWILPLQDSSRRLGTAINMLAVDEALGFCCFIMSRCDRHPALGKLLGHIESGIGLQPARFPEV